MEGPGARVGHNGSCRGFYRPVVSVLDGDTIEVLNGHHTERIRLNGIDCLENWINTSIFRLASLAV